MINGENEPKTPEFCLRSNVTYNTEAVFITKLELKEVVRV